MLWLQLMPPKDDMKQDKIVMRMVMNAQIKVCTRLEFIVLSMNLVVDSKWSFKQARVKSFFFMSKL